MEILAHVVGALAIMWGVWRVYRWGVGVVYGLPDARPAVPVSRETPEEALYAAKRHRRRVEHEQWDSQLQALMPDKCPECSGPKRRGHAMHWER